MLILQCLLKIKSCMPAIRFILWSIAFCNIAQLNCSWSYCCSNCSHTHSFIAIWVCPRVHKRTQRKRCLQWERSPWIPNPLPILFDRNENDDVVLTLEVEERKMNDLCWVSSSDIHCCCRWEETSVIVTRRKIDEVDWETMSDVCLIVCS